MQLFSSWNLKGPLYFCNKFLVLYLDSTFRGIASHLNLARGTSQSAGFFNATNTHSRRQPKPFPRSLLTAAASTEASRRRVWRRYAR